jgi:hypothetical protein
MGRHPLLTILMVVSGIILLLPGVCAVVFIVGMGTSGADSMFVLLSACLLIAFGGVMLIRQALRSPPSPPQSH